MNFTLYSSNCLEVPENCTYPHKVEISSKDTLIEAVKHDYVCAEPGLYIGKASTGRERNEKHPALVAELDSADLSVHVILHSIHGCTIDIPPELHNVLV